MRKPLAHSDVLAWFGVLGGSAAWLVQFVAAHAFGIARCDSPDARFQLPVHAWSIALAAAGTLVAVLAEVVAIRIWMATREAGSKPPGGRLHFLATVGVTVNPLALAIIVMSGVGVSLLPLCQQS
ncbi:MAG: hypothetical protein DLM64_15835 [Solirubrobacterales bacterium]|nr:MAG: hypothetical protein DLM64_15835 [Solirubrobacterales bacterium]